MTRCQRVFGTMYGLDAYVDKVLCDERADPLERLLPGCPLDVLKYSNSYDNI